MTMSKGTPRESATLLSGETHIKMLQQQLKESRESLRALAETVPQLVWVISPDCLHTYVNQRWGDYTGLTLDHVQSAPWAHLQFIHPDDHENNRAHLQHALDTGAMFEHKERLKHCQDGEYRWFLTRAMPMRNETGQIVKWFGTCTDIDEQKQIEEALRQSQERASVLMNSSIIGITIKEFLTLASHELRTPLTGITGNLQVAERRLERLKCQVTTQAESLCTFIDAAQQPLRAATQSARLQQQMIDALLDDARIQAGMFQLHRTACDLRALLTDVVTRQQQSAPTRTIALNLGPGEQAIPILADPGRIKQVLVKYLETALGASPPDQPVTVCLTVEGGTAHVSVHDEGAGISMEEQQHLWDRFYRAKGSAIQQELDLSLGLGFYLCKVFIEQHQGSVGVQSAPGQGATFWLTLP